MSTSSKPKKNDDEKPDVDQKNRLGFGDQQENFNPFRENDGTLVADDSDE